MRLGFSSYGVAPPPSSGARRSRLWVARIVTCGAVLAVPLSASAATYYVAPTGNDTAAGTEAAPFASWARAQTAASPGDTVYFRGGRYKYTDATSTCTSTTATINSVVLSKSGTSGDPINYWAYPGETPVFDFSGLTNVSKYSCRQVGVRIEGDWLYLKGLELTGVLQLNMDNHESWCLYVYGGNNNVFELLNAHHNMGPGFFMQQGGNNTFLNCDSHENEDTLTSNGDGQSADGFGCHPNQQGNTGNIFKGCRSWWNSDDAFDFIDSQEACTVEDSWSWYAGYKPDALDNGEPINLAAGNGNCFKGGGYGDPQSGVPANPPQHIIRFTAGFYCKSSGYYANHEIVNPYFYNNTAFNNGTQIDMLGLDGTTVTSVGDLKNNAAFLNNGHTLTSNMNNGGPIIDEYNSWDTNLNIHLTAADFQSIAFAPPASCPQPYAPGGATCTPPTDTTGFAGMASARQADGSLPVLPFLRPSTNSQLIGKGVNLGFPFSGAAPDLGCFDHTLGLVLLYDAGAGGSTGNIDSGPPGGDAGVDSTTLDSGGNPTSADSGGNSTSSDASGGTTGGDAGGTAARDSDGSSADGSTIANPDGSADDTGSASSSSGCSCRTTRGGIGERGAGILVLGLLAAARRRRYRANDPRRTNS
jgi:MYXO-CTERM domain-containing protein